MDEREKIVRDLLGRLTARQFDSIGELIADDAVFDVPYAAPNDTLPAMGRAAFLHMFVDVTANLFNPFELSAVAFYPSEDPTVTIVEYASKGIFSPTGRPYANRYVGIFRFRDGKITLWREYFNPEEFSRAASPA